jgi:mannosyltransferase OCH1-like enzyme
MATIPKVTHQIWFQGWNNLPEKYSKNVESLRILNQNWEHQTWDEQSLRAECEKFSPEALAKFDGYKRMIYKIDLGRYVVLHNYGGISIDCDAEPLRPLDKIPEINTSDFIISKWSRRSDFESFLCHRGLGEGLVMMNMATMACTKEHPLMKKLVEFMIENTSTYPDDVNFEEEVTTGPTIFSIFMNNFLDEVSILDPEIIEPWGQVTRRTVLNHKYACSWMWPALQWLAPHYLFIRNNLSLWIILVNIILWVLLIYLRK